MGENSLIYLELKEDRGCQIEKIYVLKHLVNAFSKIVI